MSASTSPSDELPPFSFKNLVETYQVTLENILHVGAHECEEADVYEQYVPRKNILWVDALAEKAEICRERYPGSNVVHAVVSDRFETIRFHKSSSSMSSSMLPMGTCKELHPHIHMVILDLQGVELKALRGMGQQRLSKVNYLFTEVNREEVYVGGTLVHELDEYLDMHGLVRVRTTWITRGWGDAFYVRKSLLSSLPVSSVSVAQLSEMVPYGDAPFLDVAWLLGVVVVVVHLVVIPLQKWNKFRSQS